MKIISIDTEFNNKNEILSLGVYSEEIKKELYFNNSVDKYTFEIHGLTNSFLKDYGKCFQLKDHDYIFEHDYIIGFDIFQDMKAMKVNKINNLFISNKIIDLKIIINALNIHCSLSNLFNGLSLDNTSCDLTHTAYYDAKITHLSLVEIFNISNYDNFDLFLKNCAKLTSSHYLSLEWDKEDTIYNDFNFCLKLNFKQENHNVDKINFLLKDKFIFVFYNNKCKYRFPKKYLKKNIAFSNDNKFNFPAIGVKFKADLIGRF